MARSAKTWLSSMSIWQEDAAPHWKILNNKFGYIGVYMAVQCCIGAYSAVDGGNRDISSGV